MKRALLLVDHGSTYPGSDRTVLDVMELLRRMAPAGTAVEYAHMGFAEPTVAQGFARCVDAGAEEIVGQPLMLAPGRHATLDIPNLAAAAAAGFPGVRYRIGAYPWTPIQARGDRARTFRASIDRWERSLGTELADSSLGGTSHRCPAAPTCTVILQPGPLFRRATAGPQWGFRLPHGCELSTFP